MAQGQNPFDTPQYAAGSRFETVAKHVLGIEGGFSDNASDRGGTTNHGISLRFLRAEGKFDLDHNGHPDLDLDFDGDLDGHDIRLLTAQQSLNLFYLCFWHRFDLDRLPVPIDGAVFDQAVNGGAVAAVKMLQRALNRLAVASGDLKVDGVLGNQTIGRVFTAGRVRQGYGSLVMAYRQEAEARYNAIVRADSSQVVNLAGWVARARRLGDV